MKKGIIFILYTIIVLSFLNLNVCAATTDVEDVTGDLVFPAAANLKMLNGEFPVSYTTSMVGSYVFNDITPNQIKEIYETISNNAHDLSGAKASYGTDDGRDFYIYQTEVTNPNPDVYESGSWLESDEKLSGFDEIDDPIKDVDDRTLWEKTKDFILPEAGASELENGDEIYTNPGIDNTIVTTGVETNLFEGGTGDLVIPGNSGINDITPSSNTIGLPPYNYDGIKYTFNDLTEDEVNQVLSYLSENNIDMNTEKMMFYSNDGDYIIYQNTDDSSKFDVQKDRLGPWNSDIGTISTEEVREEINLDDYIFITSSGHYIGPDNEIITPEDDKYTTIQTLKEKESMKDGIINIDYNLETYEQRGNIESIGEQKEDNNKNIFAKYIADDVVTGDVYYVNGIQVDIETYFRMKDGNTYYPPEKIKEYLDTLSSSTVSNSGVRSISLSDNNIDIWPSDENLEDAVGYFKEGKQIEYNNEIYTLTNGAFLKEIDPTDSLEQQLSNLKEGFQTTIGSTIYKKDTNGAISKQITITAGTDANVKIWEVVDESGTAIEKITTSTIESQALAYLETIKEKKNVIITPTTELQKIALAIAKEEDISSIKLTNGYDDSALLLVANLGHTGAQTKIIEKVKDDKIELSVSESITLYAALTDVSDKKTLIDETISWYSNEETNSIIKLTDDKTLISSILLLQAIDDNVDVCKGNDQKCTDALIKDNSEDSLDLLSKLVTEHGVELTETQLLKMINDLPDNKKTQALIDATYNQDCDDFFGGIACAISGYVDQEDIIEKQILANTKTTTDELSTIKKDIKIVIGKDNDVCAGENKVSECKTKITAACTDNDNKVDSNCVNQAESFLLKNSEITDFEGYNKEITKKYFEEFGITINNDLIEACDGDSTDKCNALISKLSICEGETKNEDKCQLLKDTIDNIQEQQVVETNFLYTAIDYFKNPDQNALKAMSYWGFENDYSNVPQWLGESVASQLCYAKIEGYLDKEITQSGGATKYGCDMVDSEKGKDYEDPNCNEIIADIRAQRTSITPDNVTGISYSYYLKSPSDMEVAYLVAISYFEDGVKQSLALMNATTASEDSTIKRYEQIDLPVSGLDGIDLDSFTITLAAIYEGSEFYVLLNIPVYLADATTISTSIEENGNTIGNEQAKLQGGNSNSGLTSSEILNLI